MKELGHVIIGGRRKLMMEWNEKEKVGNGDMKLKGKGINLLILQK